MTKIDLKELCRNDYGFLDVTPGTDVAHRLTSCSNYIIKKWIRKGWLRKIGIGLVLTSQGYHEM